MLSTTALELLVAQLVAEFRAPLHQQQLVDGVDDELRRDLRRAPSSAPRRFRAHRRCAGAERRDLALFELGLREDLAVHLHEDLLDDLGAQSGWRAAPTNAASARLKSGFHRGLSLIHPKLLQTSILSDSKYRRSDVPEQAPRPGRTSRRRGADLLRRPQNLVLGEPGRHLPGLARAVHQERRAGDRVTALFGAGRRRPGQAVWAWLADTSRSSFTAAGGTSVTSPRCGRPGPGAPGRAWPAA